MSLINKWISTKEKLPELGEEVLVYSYEDKINNGMYIAWIDSFGKENAPIWQYSYCCGCFVPSEVTHWQPKPDDPETSAKKQAEYDYLSQIGSY